MGKRHLSQTAATLIMSLLFVRRTQTKPAHRGISLLVIEDGTEGFKRGKQLNKVGMHSGDTAELIFDNAKVPVENLLGEEGKGFLLFDGATSARKTSSCLAGPNRS